MASARTAGANHRSARMARYRRSNVMRLSATLMMLPGLAAGASAQDLKTWRHGIIEAKSDAGILYMASKRDFAGKLGLKLDFVQLKNDTIALKALLAGELDSYEGAAGGAMPAAAPGAEVKIVRRQSLAAAHSVYGGPRVAPAPPPQGKALPAGPPRTFPAHVAHCA